jgi:methyl-accepting chemotaxis protein
MNLTIGKKIALGFSLALAMIAIIGTTAFRSTSKLIETAGWSEHTTEVIASVEDLLSGMKDAETGQRGYLLTGEEHYLEPYTQSRAPVEREFQELRKLTADNPNQQRRLGALEPLIADKYRELQETIDLRKDKDKGVEAALQVVRTDRGKKVMDEIRKVITEMKDEENELLKKRSDEAQLSAHNAKSTILIGALVSFVLLSVVGFFITRSITRPLVQFMLFVEQVGKGDLTKTAANSTRDELGQLGHTLNQMVAGLKDVANQTRTAAENLNSASAEMMASTQQQASSTSEQAAAVQETTATIEEINQAGTQISEKARRVATAAEATASTSAAGLQAVQNTNRTMEGIREQAEAVAENVVTLSEKTQAVGEIIATVNDIAEQSNLLALNAAIEAAAAGEQGRSFSVVATEIKNLADQAKQATVQVRSILGEIQKGINSSVMLTEEAVKRVDSGKQQAEVTEKTIRQMSDGIQESIQAFQQIVASTNQQQIGLEQVSQAMKNIRQATEQTASGTTQLEKATVNINALGQQLRKAVERYQV